jgi:hypothetical protein
MSPKAKRASLKSAKAKRAQKQSVPTVNEIINSFAPRIRKILKSRKTTPEAEALFLEDPSYLVLAGLLHTLIDVINPQLPDLIRSVKIDAFGLSDNRLDPLNFNGQMRASASGDACTPRECVDLGPFGSVCTPSICAGGEAHANLDSLTGLSGLQIQSINVTQRSIPKSPVRTANADLIMSIPAISARGSAGASGGPLGIHIPVDASISAFMSFPIATLKTRIVYNIDPPKLTAFKLESMDIGGGAFGLQIRLSGLGPFDSIGDEVVSLLQTQIAPLIVGDGTISQAARNLLQDKINDYIKNQG